MRWNETQNSDGDDPGMKYNGLIAGLGNPGSRYALSRHNMGYLFIDELLRLCSSTGLVSELNGKKFSSLLWKIEMPKLEGIWLAAKPLTFMNNSGSAIQPLLAWNNLRPDQLVVAQDELDLPAGELRFKFGGGLAGHNGLRSITNHIGTKDYYRLRIGVGKPLQKEQTIDWVLSSPAPAEKEKILSSLPFALETFFIFTRCGFERAAEYAHAAAKNLVHGMSVRASSSTNPP